MVSPKHVEDYEAAKAAGIDVDSEELATSDRAHRGLGFRVWLRDEADGRFDPIKEAVKARPEDFPVTFDAPAWAAGLGFDSTMVSLLAIAETEWRAARAGYGASRRSIMAKTMPGMDFHTPIPHISGCLYRRPGGEVCCGKPVIPGTVRCEGHGGTLIDATTRRAVLMGTYLQLVEASGVAVGALVDVLEHSKNDLARVAAAKEVLDRAGLTADLNINISIDSDGKDARMEALKERLNTMREGLLARVIDTTATEDTPMELDA